MKRPQHHTRLTLLSLFLFATAFAPAQNADWQDTWPDLGAEVYEAQCASCHGSSGEGTIGLFPALADNDFVTGDPADVIHVVLEGRGAMPSFDELDDEEIAAVVSYIRNSWDNDAEPVEPEEVAELRNDDNRSSNPENSTAAELFGEDWHARAQELYVHNCAACHQEDGEGIAGIFPPLAGNPLVTADQPTTRQALIEVILHGRGGMPGFEGWLSEQEIALILTYIRTAWDNDAPPIGEASVARVSAGESLEDTTEDNELEEAPDPAEEEEDDPTARPGAAD